MSDETDITKKIKETKKQTEELKTQLQNLIDKGKTLVCPSQSNSNLVMSKNEEEKGVKPPNKVQILKSYENKHSKPKPEHPNIPTKTVNTDTPKKSRRYDVNEAREYMKKQKERRLEQSKTHNEAKVKAEMQKKKLQELHKKSLELLAKNVVAKRERSKSRDRNVYVRPDDATNLTSQLRKAKSMDKMNNFGVQHKNPNLLYPPSPDYKNKRKGNAQKEPEKIVILARNFTHRGDLTHAEKRKEPTNVTLRRHNINKNENAQLEQVDNKQETNNTIKDTISTKINKNDKNKTTESIGFEPLKPRKLFNTKDVDIPADHSSKTSIESVKNILEYKSTKSSRSNVTVPSLNTIEMVKVDKNTNLNVTPAEEEKIISNVQRAPTDKITKHSKEIQTDAINKEYPKWLEEQPPRAHPFNFMSTITRKLQVAADKQRNTIDIGIQNSLISPNPIEKLEVLVTSKSQENSNRDLRSFISHKCLNLDPGAIEHLELVPKKNVDFVKKFSTHLSTQVTETGSESDTSKNIPDISSESGTSLKKNKESVRKALMLDRNLAISTDKIDNMKLVPHSTATTTTIRSDSELHSESKSKNTHKKNVNTLLSVENNPYASDFDSDVELSEENLNRSRKSIISFNRSGYNKVPIPNPESPSNVSSSPKSTERSQISPQKTVSGINTDNMLLSSRNKIASKRVGNSEKNEFSLEKNKSQSSEGKSNNRNPVDLSKSISSLSKSDSSLKTVDNSKRAKDTSKDEDFESNGKISHIDETDHQNMSKHTESRMVTSSKNSLVGTDIQPSGSLSTNVSKSELSCCQNINTERGCASSTVDSRADILPLTEPKLSLMKKSEGVKSQIDDGSRAKNITVRSSKVSTKTNANDTNQIHLKFEAEIHLLNDFNESLRRFSALEQALETLKSNNKMATSKIVQNNDAEASVTTAKNSRTSSTRISGNVVGSRNSQSHNSQINFSRGSFVNTSIDDDPSLLTNSALDDKDNISVLLSTGLEISNLNSINQSLPVRSQDNLSNFENLQDVNFAGLSLNMFEQLIKDEDIRLENLKTILKIREQALLDRTKGELAWLEIQRKHFKETGKLHEASVIKKKQRGILVNHQKEKHEMQRLKQMQKAASIERKIVLKEQRNLIRQQLSTDNMLTKMKVNVPREKRFSGPLKVLQSHTESIRSETSITKRSSSDRERDVLSITSHQSTTHHSIVSEISEVEISSKDVTSMEHHKHIKRTLLMREEALKKRRKAAEELLQWHKKLLEEEKRIAILESTASAIISQKPSTLTSQEKFNFKGKQLNQLWLNLTGSEGKKFVNDKIYPMSQLALERFCKSAREYSLKTKTLLKRSSETDISASDNIPTQKIGSEKDYVSDFDNESIAATEEIDVVDQSIDILINNFNQIQDDISILNIKQTRQFVDSPSEDIISDKLDKTESDVEISVIETNRTKSVAVSEKIKESSASNEEEKETIDENVPGIDSISEKSSKIAASLVEDIVVASPVVEKITSEKIKSSRSSEESLKIKDVIPETPIIVATDASERLDADYSSKIKISPEDISAVDGTVSKFDQNMSDKSTKKSTSDVTSTKSSTDNKSSVASDIHAVDQNSSPQISKSELENLESRDVSNKSSRLTESLLVIGENDSEGTDSDVLSEKSPKTKSPDNKLSLTDAVQTILSDQSSSLKTSLEEHGKDISQFSTENKVGVTEEKPIVGERIEETKDMGDATIPAITETKESLSESQEILLILGESEVKTSSDEEVVDVQLKDSLTESEEILSKLSQTADELDTIPKIVEPTVKDREQSDDQEELSSRQTDERDDRIEELGESESKSDTATDEESVSKASQVDMSKIEDVDKSETELTGSPLETSSGNSLSKPDEDIMSQSLLRLYAISKSDKVSAKEGDDSSNVSEDALQDTSAMENFIKNELNQARIYDNSSLKLFEGPEETTNIDEISKPTGDDLDDEDIIETVAKLVTDVMGSDENTLYKEKICNEIVVGEDTVEKSSVQKPVPKETFEIDRSLKIDNNNETCEGDESKLTLSDKSNESFIINDINDEPAQNQDQRLEESEKLSKELEIREVSDKFEEIIDDTKTDKDSSVTEEVEEEEESDSRDSSKPISNLSYGILEKSRPEREQSDSHETDDLLSKEEVCLEEKEHDSLSSVTGGSSSDLSEQVASSTKDKYSEVISNKNAAQEVDDRSKKSDSEDSSRRDVMVDVKKRVSEILADTNSPRGDKSPRLQDLYVTTYDLISPANSPERAPSSPIEEHKLVSSIFDSEAEEILRKQLAVEEEIKAITEQQQKEQVPLMYIREIPNKPPPPYTPPSSLAPTPVPTIIPTSEEIEEITMYSAKILHKAYLSKNLANVNISNNTLSLISKNISKECYKFVFDLCKDIAREHYKQFEEDSSLSWLRISKKVELTLVKPLDPDGLKIHMIKKLKEIFGYHKSPRRENAIMKWSRKKRDHVDEILVMECQQEEAQWINYQKDELLVKDQLTNEMLDNLLKDTADVLAKIFFSKN